METVATLLSSFAAFVLSVLLTFSTFLGMFTAQVEQQVSPAPVAHIALPAQEGSSAAAEAPPPAAATSTRTISAKEATPLPAEAPTAQPPAPLIDSQTLAAQSRAALANIYCTIHEGRITETVSGSGSFIDPRGVILTNAHVAQFFLLKNYPGPSDTICTIRTGSPARESYYAELLYLPPAWIADNASQITAAEPKGTGKDDYAFLLVTSKVGGGPLPASFPSVSVTTTEPKLDSVVLLAAYPAEALKIRALENDLNIDTAYAGVTKLFTFDDRRKVDLFSIGGTEVSQSGSSGGAVLRIYDGALEGIITTATENTDTIARDLRAITIAHIDRSLAEYNKGGISPLLSQNLTNEAADFNKTLAPAETQILINAFDAARSQ